MRFGIRHTLAGTAVALALTLAGSARATSLDLVLLDSPDIVSGFIDVGYDAAVGQLRASGFPLELYAESLGGSLAIDEGSFQLDATISSDGSLAGGWLSIRGTIASVGFLSGTLLTADLTALGFPDGSGDHLEFLLDPTGGDTADLYGGPDSVLGLILHDTGFAGFDADFDNLIAGFSGTGAGTADVAPIPEPSTGLLFALGIAGLWGAGSKRRRSERPTA